MKKHTCLLLGFFIPFFSFAQAVKETSFSQSQQARPVSETEPVLFSGLPAKSRLAVSFSSDGSRLYVTTSGAGWGASTIDAGDELVLRFSNDSTVVLRSVALQSFEADLFINTYKHRYILSEAGLNALRTFSLASIRKYSFKTFTDLKIPAENSEKLKRLCALFAARIGKGPLVEEVAQAVKKAPASMSANVKKAAQVTGGATDLKQISVKDIQTHIGDSVSFCSKVYKIRYFPASEGSPTVLDVQADFYDPVVNLVIWGKYRDQFSMAPEKLYANKDVCVSGVVKVRNNVPYLNIRNMDQIRIGGEVNLAEVGTVVGDSITVTGKVFTASYENENGQRPTLLSMGAPFPKQALTLVIRDEERKNFGVPEALYLNKTVRVSGKVTRYNNEPRMMLYNKSQIEVLTVQDTVTTFAVVQTEAGPKQVARTAFKEEEPAKPVVKSAQSKERVAEYPGGDNGFAAFLSKKLVYPEELAPGEQKQVVVSFEIDANGACRDIKILSSAGYVYDQEVKRVLLQMPKWKPAAVANGSYKSSRLTQTVTFKGQDATAQKPE